MGASQAPNYASSHLKSVPIEPDNTETLAANNTNVNSISNLATCTANEFIIFVCNLCIKHEFMFDETDIKSITVALTKININGKQFTAMNRVNFCHKFREYGIESSTASKLYTLIEQKQQNIAQYLQSSDINHRLSITSSVDSSSTPSMRHISSKLLFSMHTNDLASMVRYVLENEPAFAKYKHEAESVHQQFLNHKIKGKMLRKLSRVEFANELRWVRSVITTELYVWLKTLSDDEVVNILHQIDQPVHQNLNQNHFPFAVDQPNIDNLSTACSIVDRVQYSQDIVDQLVVLGYGTELECIQASALCVNYRDINEVTDKLSEITSKMELKMYDAKAFQIFVYNLCVMHKYDIVVVETLLGALIDIGMDGKKFLEIKRIEFCRKLKKYNIKSAKAAALYKLIMDNHGNVAGYLQENNICFVGKTKQLSCHDLGDIVVKDFQQCARSMLKEMNEMMKRNLVNGFVLVEHYKNKHALKMYLKENVTHSSVNVLVGLMWDDYERDNDKINTKIKGYNRKQLLKYFISLYMYHVRCVIIKHDLTGNKCVSLKRKAICDIFVSECGFSVGVATKFVDKIFSKIN